MDNSISSLSFLADENVEEDGDAEAMTAAQVLGKLREAWLNEKFSPELLPSQAEIVDCVIDQLHEMQRNIDRVKKADFKIGIHKMEIDRIRFMLSSYLRIRLQKIERFTDHILEQDKQADVHLLTDEERTYATSYQSGMMGLFKSVALQNLQLNIQGLDTKKTAVLPNLDSYVFVKVLKDVAGVVVEEETDDSREEIIDLETSDQHIVRYKPMAVLIRSGDVVLL